VVCEIGGASEVHRAIDRIGAPIIATRRKAGVLAFGSDAEVRRVFEEFNITEFDFYSLEPRRLAYESAERGLLLEALARAICRMRPLKAERKGSSHFLTIEPGQENNPALAPLRGLTQSLAGKVPDTDLAWREAAKIRIERQLGRSWMLVLPTIWVEATETEEDDAEDADDKAARAEFVRERTATRYNKTWNSLLDAWTSIIIGGANDCDLRAFGVSDGVDAVFSISRLTGFSRAGVTQWKPKR
jgi:hypothetical protein